MSLSRIYIRTFTIHKEPTNYIHGIHSSKLIFHDLHTVLHTSLYPTLLRVLAYSTFWLWTILAYSPFGYELFLHIHLLAMTYSCIFTFWLWTILAYSPFGYELFLHIHLLAMNYLSQQLYHYSYVDMSYM